MNDLPALSSFKHLRGKHYHNKNHPTTPMTTTFSKATTIITPPIMETPPYPPPRHTQTHNSLWIDFNVLMFFHSGFKNPSFFPKIFLWRKDSVFYKYLGLQIPHRAFDLLKARFVIRMSLILTILYSKLIFTFFQSCHIHKCLACPLFIRPSAGCSSIATWQNTSVQKSMVWKKTPHPRAWVWLLG